MSFVRNHLVSLLVVVCLLGGAAVLGRGLNEWREYPHWELDLPLDLVIDCSQPGTYEGGWQQTCPRAQREIVGLKLPDTTFNLLSPVGVNALLRGLRATLTVKSADTGEIVVQTESRIVEGLETWQGLVPVFHLPAFPKGRFQTLITITDGAPALRNLPQQLQARYLLSGRELRPAGHRIIAGSIAITVALGLWISVWLVGLIRQLKGETGIRANPASETAPADPEA